ncbi:MAG: hypothetical protein HY819_05325 [Acidobacteria bacterium]|nr:hypothetical protein [Acidobacteriota bacterium]
MLKVILSIITLLAISLEAHAQANKKPEFIRYDLVKGLPNDNISPLEDGPPFIPPKNSLVKLQRQVIMQFLPSTFTPFVEPEQDSSKRKLIRYGFAYYRDNEIPGFPGFRDIIVPLRFDSTKGFLDVTYYRNVLIVPFTFDFPENRSSIALLPQDEGTALLLFLEGTSNKFLLSLSNLFDEPKMVNFLAFDEVEAIQSDAEFEKFIIFTRGGTNRSSLFVSTTSASLNPISPGVELIKDLPINNESYIFKVSPNTELKFRGAPVPPKTTTSVSQPKE